MIERTYLRIVVLSVLAFLYIPFRGRAVHVTHNIQKVGTIYLTGNIGDMIFCTPIFRALKHEKSEIEVCVIGRKHNAETLKYNEDVDTYVVCPNSLFALWKEVRALKLDYAYLVDASVPELAVLYLANVKTIAVFSSPDVSRETLTYRILKHLCILVPFAPDENVARKNLRLLSPLGIESDDTHKHLFYSAEASQVIQAFFSTNDIMLGTDFVIALAPGAGTKLKQWPANRFAELADHLYRKYKLPLFIVGGPGDRKEFEQMEAVLSHGTKIISCLHHTIDELKAFVAHIDLMIANDSAPIYVAEAFNKAAVTIVGPTDENEHPPKGGLYRIVKSKGRGVPALTANKSSKQHYSHEYAREQIERVTVDQVVETVDSLITEIKSV